MPQAQPAPSKEDIARALKQRAIELWGRQRAEAIGPTIEQTAANIWRISQHLPDEQEEPAFYL